MPGAEFCGLATIPAHCMRHGLLAFQPCRACCLVAVPVGLPDRSPLLKRKSLGLLGNRALFTSPVKRSPFMPQGNKRPEPPGARPLSARYRGLKYWIIGLILLLGVIVAAKHLGDIDRFAQLVKQARPEWLIAALFFQAATYFTSAAVWRQALTRTGAAYPLLPLVPLSLAKLYMDQALPSGGISGTMFFIAALNRRGLSTGQCMSALIISLTGYYAAYIFAALVTIMLLAYYHDLNVWVLTIAALLCTVAVVISIGVLWLAHWGRRPPPAFLKRVPSLHYLVEAFGQVPGTFLRSPSFFAKVTALEGVVFLLDAATLWVMLRALGQDVSFFVAFPSFIVASMVMTLGPVPLGLGTFEAACVTMLKTLGVSIEAALTSTLLLRGFTLWLPMLPGIWLTKRELR